jgi:hypothetical protein
LRAAGKSCREQLRSKAPRGAIESESTSFFRFALVGVLSLAGYAAFRRRLIAVTKGELENEILKALLIEATTAAPGAPNVSRLGAAPVGDRPAR